MTGVQTCALPICFPVTIKVSAKITDEEKKALEAEGKEVNQISATQLSYDSRLENLDKLIMLLESVPYYKPNEEVLKLNH